MGACSTSPHGAGDASCVVNGGDDVIVGSAAAEVAAHPVADRLRRAGVALVDAGDASHDLSGRAIAALESITLDEGGLKWVELLALRQALDGRDFVALNEGRERQARFDAFAVHQHRARTALAKATSLLRSGKFQVLAQRVEQCGARIESQPVLGPVDAQ